MRNVTDIVLEQAIAHKLMRSGNGGMKLSQCADPLLDAQLIGYYSNLIKESLKDAGTKVANFEEMSQGLTSGICRDLLQEKHLFNWSDIPGDDTGLFIKFLKENYKIDWIIPDEIKKVNGDEKIEIISSPNRLSMSFNKEKTHINLEIDNVSRGSQISFKNWHSNLIRISQSKIDLSKI